jgi:peptide/nickel transport system permease protein
MSGYAGYVVRRLGQFVLVVFVGISLIFLVTHLTPIDPVQQTITALSTYGQTSPKAVALMRKSLQQLYGTTGSLPEQYIVFWTRMVRGDFGPSLSAFPTPVITLIGRALPWTAGLMLSATALAWGLGNLLGGLAGYYRHNLLLRLAGVVAIALQPIPYYIFAFVLLILFGYVWPILPISGGAQINLNPSFSAAYIGSVLLHSILPAASIVLAGIGSWFFGMRNLTANIISEDYVRFAELANVDRGTVLFSYVMRNAALPQLTGLAMSIGTIFSGAVITEYVFGYPGIGKLLVDAVNAGDYSLVLGVASISIVAVSTAVLMIDLLYPLLDPRMRTSQ